MLHPEWWNLMSIFLGLAALALPPLGGALLAVLLVNGVTAAILETRPEVQQAQLLPENNPRKSNGRKQEG